MKKEKFKVIFIGGKQAGCIGILSTIAANCEIIAVVAYDKTMETLAKKLNLKIFKSVKEKGFRNNLDNSDLLISVHGREVIEKDFLKKPTYGCINVHPCLYKYKGKNPIGRLLENNDSKASVGIHYMDEEIDSGEVILEKFVDVSDKNTIEAVYNELYPYYAIGIIEVIDKIRMEI
jgi:methionyl-tRNA formyltransferase